MALKFPDALTLLLGIRVGSSLRIVNPPKGFLEALAPLPPGVAIVEVGALGIDVQVLFAAKKVELVEELAGMVRRMSPSGRIWLSIPRGRKDDSAPCDDFARLAALELGLIEEHMLILSDAWLAYKLKRKGRRPRARMPRAAA